MILWADMDLQTETVWQQTNKHNVPCMCFLNKMNQTGTNLYFCVDTIMEMLGATSAVLQPTIGTEGDFPGAIDLITTEAFI